MSINPAVVKRIVDSRKDERAESIKRAREANQRVRELLKERKEAIARGEIVE